jgi:hypothetical protein
LTKKAAVAWRLAESRVDVDAGWVLVLCAGFALDQGLAVILVVAAWATDAHVLLWLLLLLLLLLLWRLMLMLMLLRLCLVDLLLLLRLRLRLTHRVHVPVYVLITKRSLRKIAVAKFRTRSGEIESLGAIRRNRVPAIGRLIAQVHRTGIDHRVVGSRPLQRLPDSEGPHLPQTTMPL